MSEKGLGSKFLGLFVETDGSASRLAEDDLPPKAGAPPGSGEKSPAEIVAELAQGSGGASRAAKVPPSSSPLRTEKLAMGNAAEGKPTDFDAIFRDAGMDPGELDWVKKAQDLLRSLPEATPQPVKRQIVEASLKAFGFDVQKIPTAAENQKRALHAYVRVNETATAKAVTDAQGEIQKLNEQIAKLRAEIERRNAQLASVAAQAQTRKAEVQKVIEFFQSPVATQS